MIGVGCFKHLKIVLRVGFIFLLSGCETKKVEEVNIGYIGPLSTRATDLGVGPSKAMRLAIDQYNDQRVVNEPKVNFFLQDDQWEKSRALPAYDKLRKEHDIDIVFMSNTDGVVAVQQKILEDNVVLVNPLNNDALLSSLNKNTFKVAKSTEGAMELVALRIIQLKLKKVIIMQYPNDFMRRGATAVKKLLDTEGIENRVVEVQIGDTLFTDQLKLFKSEGYEAYVFFGYKEFGFAMKQARDIGVTAPFFGSPGMLDPQYYDNAEGTIVGTEFPFFTPSDGNYVLAQEFLTSYENRFGEKPFSVWPPMHAYDAMSLVLNEIKDVNKSKGKEEKIGDWLREALYKVKHYQGVCGNIAITSDGSSRGIYFSLYHYNSKGKIELVKKD